jgi:hypothetical protein
MEVCGLLEINYPALVYLMRYRKIPLPAKDGSGDFVWTDKDIARARAALAKIRKPKAKVPA